MSLTESDQGSSLALVGKDELTSQIPQFVSDKTGKDQISIIGASVDFFVILKAACSPFC